MKKNILIFSIFGVFMCILICFIINPSLPQSNNDKILKINDELEFSKISSKLTLLKYNSIVIVTPVIKEFAITDSRLYVIQNPDENFLNYSLNDGSNIVLDKSKTYYWIIDLSTNQVEEIYTKEEFKNRFKDLYEKLEFRKLDI